MWNVKVGAGWLDDNPPPDVRSAAAKHADRDAHAVLLVQSDSGLSGGLGISETSFFGMSTELSTIADAFGSIQTLLIELENESADTVSLMLLRFNSPTTLPEARPESFISDADSVQQGLRRFFGLVSGDRTLNPEGHPFFQQNQVLDAETPEALEEIGLSPAEWGWVMITCTKQL